MKKIIIEPVSPNGSWSSNLSSQHLDKTFMEYMKLCDIIPGKKLNNKFLIVPSYKINDTLICLYFVDNDISLDVDEFVSKLKVYLENPKAYDDNLKLSESKKTDESAIWEDDEYSADDQVTSEERKKNEQVYEETGYDIIGRSPRKSSFSSACPNPKYIKRGSFSNVATGVDLTNIDVEKKLVYLMNEEYFFNFQELENLKNSNVFFFENPNSKVSGSQDIVSKIIDSLKSHNTDYAFISEF